ncbi:MAG: helix-turn-helix domain-containing protein [archaeon]
MEDDLRDIGLSKNEAKIYIAVAELGSTTIGDIAKKIKIHRTNVYDAIEGLVKRGLVSHIIKDKVKYFQLTNPDNLLNMIREKEDKARSILPKLTLLNDMAPKSESQVLEGLPAAKRVMDGFLKHNDSILVMGVSSNVSELIGPFLTNFHSRRIKEKIVMKHIYNSDAHSRINILKSMDYTEVRVLPSKFDSPVATNIVGDEVALIHWSKNPIIMRIRNQVIADAYKNYFELLWANAKKV